jgi:hypothetical protein
VRSAARFTARFPNSEAVLLVLLVNYVFFSSELNQYSQSAQTSDLLTIENAVHEISGEPYLFINEDGVIIFYVDNIVLLYRPENISRLRRLRTALI